MKKVYVFMSDSGFIKVFKNRSAALVYSIQEICEDAQENPDNYDMEALIGGITGLIKNNRTMDYWFFIEEGEMAEEDDDLGLV